MMEFTCPICHEGVPDPAKELVTLPCSGCHRFHPDCIKTWLLAPYSANRKCPMCRESLTHACGHTLSTALLTAGAIIRPDQVNLQRRCDGCRSIAPTMLMHCELCNQVHDRSVSRPAEPTISYVMAVLFHALGNSPSPQGLEALFPRILETVRYTWDPNGDPWTDRDIVTAAFITEHRLAQINNQSRNGNRSDSEGVDMNRSSESNIDTAVQSMIGYRGGGQNLSANAHSQQEQPARLSSHLGTARNHTQGFRHGDNNHFLLAMPRPYAPRTQQIISRRQDLTSESDSTAIVPAPRIYRHPHYRAASDRPRSEPNQTTFTVPSDRASGSSTPLTAPASRERRIDELGALLRFRHLPSPFVPAERRRAGSITPNSSQHSPSRTTTPDEREGSRPFES
ncbi:hypothetical protein BX600DRAFT_436735 [Xylariales sp. PMI_506]|nr:hypothetical protein BX600DRAFT_436735 [Xylariales sp. PMI_506]